jgi:hypothetical protein
MVLIRKKGADVRSVHNFRGLVFPRVAFLSICKKVNNCPTKKVFTITAISCHVSLEMTIGKREWGSTLRLQALIHINCKDWAKERRQRDRGPGKSA